MSSGKTDVAQLVIRADMEEGYRYFIARRTLDSYWEWIGGKREEGESIEETSGRELREELKVDWDSFGFEIVGVADSYPSEKDSSYHLVPVMIEVGEEVYEEVSAEHLSKEHDSFEWIELTEFDEYNTLGQYRALEKLDLVEGDVALAVAGNDGEYLFVQRSEENTSSGRWSFVSGQIQEEEKPEEAAVRELREETGLESEILRSDDFYIGEGERGYWRLFPVLLEADSREVDLNWELSDHEWLEISEAQGKKTLGRMKAVEKLGL